MGLLQGLLYNRVLLPKIHFLPMTITVFVTNVFFFPYIIYMYSINFISMNKIYNDEKKLLFITIRLKILSQKLNFCVFKIKIHNTLSYVTIRMDGCAATKPPMYHIFYDRTLGMGLLFRQNILV